MSKEKNLALEIRKTRVRLNMSQERFAQRLGISGKSISAYETGKCCPPLKVLEAISKMYSVGFVQLEKSRKQWLEVKIKAIKQALAEIENTIENSLSF